MLNKVIMPHQYANHGIGYICRRHGTAKLVEVLTPVMLRIIRARGRSTYGFLMRLYVIRINCDHLLTHQKIH